MGRSLSNDATIAYAEETALGVAGTAFTLTQPNSIDQYGAEIGTVSRDPINPSRQRFKGATVDLDSSVEYGADLTMSSLRDHIEAYCFAIGVNTDVTQLAATAAANASGDYTLSSALVGSQIDRFLSASAGSTLIWVSGFTTSSNNGLKAIDTDATTSTALSVSDTLADETGATARISFAGHRVAAGESITWTWSGASSQGTLAATGLGTLLQGLDLTVGQMVHFGSVATGAADRTIQNAFDNGGANDAYGYARVVSISADAIVFDKVDTLLQTSLSDPGELDILFGEFVRNVPRTDAAYLERSYTFEQALPGLGDGTVGNTDDSYRYARGNYANAATFTFALGQLATVSYNFVGTDTDNPTTSRLTGADSASAPVQTNAFNTAADFARLRVTEADEDGITTDFKNFTLTLANNASGEKVLGQLGPKFLNVGNFEASFEAELLFTNSLVIDKIRGNETVTMEVVLKNDDGVVAFDFPSLTLSGGSTGFPRDESVTISVTGQTFADPTLNTSIGVSLFPVPLP